MNLTAHDALPPETSPAPEWAQALDTGAPGLALLHLEYAHAGAGSWDTAQAWIQAMHRPPSLAEFTHSLHRGAPAVAFTLRAAVRRDHPSHAGYTRALGVWDEHVTTITSARLAQAHRRIDERQLPNLREFDLIGGLTGLGTYQLHRHAYAETTAEQAAAREHLLDVLAYLVRLAEPIQPGPDPQPGWWTDNDPADQPDPAQPGGHANLGMAHGIAGPLALLSLATLAGIIVPDQEAAIARIAAWFDRWQQQSPAGPWWPETVTEPEWRSGILRHTAPGRPSWCYGTPGLARAQQLAGLALHDRTRQRAAEHALAQCLVDPTQLDQLTDHSLCHGWAGVLHIAWRTARDAGPDTTLSQVLPELRGRSTTGHPDPVTTGDGMLVGLAGVKLAELTTSNDTAPITGWDTSLLIACPTTNSTTPPMQPASPPEREITRKGQR